MTMADRIQKIISAHGDASRRTAEKMIEEGRVTVNGVTAKLGDTAEESDEIRIDGKLLKSRDKLIYIMLNKPKGYVSTASDEKGRKTVIDLVKDCGVRVYPIGRLDLNSRGLILLTNDGELTQKLSHPSGGKTKKYLVTVTGDVDAAFPILNDSMVIDGYKTRPAVVKFVRAGENGTVLSFTLSEGRNRQIRKMCEQCSLTVKDLFRTQYGKLSLGKLPSGQWRYLTKDEVKLLQNNDT